MWRIPVMVRDSQFKKDNCELDFFQVVEQTDFNKRHKSVSFKPFNFACILKFSKAQLQEKAFKVSIDQKPKSVVIVLFCKYPKTVSNQLCFVL